MDARDIKRLLYKQLTGELSSEEEAWLRQWRESDKNNEELYHRITSFSFLEQAVTETPRIEAMHSWETVRHRIGYRKFLSGDRRRLRTMAAACLLLLAGAFYWKWYTAQPNVLSAGMEKATIYMADGKAIEMNDRMQSEFYRLQESGKADAVELSPDLHHTVVVPRGGEYSLTLADQTSIHLNAQSSLTVPVDFSAHNRSVNLSGEAYFNVKSDKSHPFRVETNKGEIIVKGTCFNIKNYKEDPCMVITLEDGIVEINSAYRQATIFPGEQAIVNEQGEIEKREVDTFLSCAWHQNRIAYEDEPLINILTDLGRWYNFEAAYADDELRNLRFSMEIDKKADFNEVAELLERLNKIQIQIKRNNKCIITSK